jgi:hypothetical protein
MISNTFRTHEDHGTSIQQFNMLIWSLKARFLFQTATAVLRWLTRLACTDISALVFGSLIFFWVKHGHLLRFKTRVGTGTSVLPPHDNIRDSENTVPAHTDQQVTKKSLARSFVSMLSISCSHATVALCAPFVSSVKFSLNSDLVFS